MTQSLTWLKCMKSQYMEIHQLKFIVLSFFWLNVNSKIKYAVIRNVFDLNGPKWI